MLLCKSIWVLRCSRTLVLALMLLCQFVMHCCYCALNVEPLVLALMLLCLYIVALMLLCMMYVLVLRVLEPVVGTDVIVPLGFLDVLNPTGYSLYLLLQFQFWDSEQYSIPYVWEIVLSYVLVQGGVVDPDEHGFLDGSCHIVLFSANDLEVVH